MCRKGPVKAVVLTVALLAGIPGSAALAGEFSLVPSLNLNGEYNDNILFAVAAPQSSFISTLSPHLTLNQRSERLSVLLDAGLSYLNYSARHDLDSLDQAYRGQFHYRLTPRLNLQASAGFDRDSRPDRFVETSGLVTTRESDRQSYNGAFDMALTEKLSGQLAYVYQQVDYRGSSVSGEQLHSVTSGLLYDLSEVVPLLKLRTNLAYSNSGYTTATVENYSTTVGFSYPLHELWSIQADAGGRYTRSTFDKPVSNSVAALEQSSEDIGWVASMALTYRGELNSASLGVSRTVQNAAGRSSSTELTAVTAEVRHRFSYELSGSLSGGYYQNSSVSEQFSSQAIDETTYRIRPVLRYEFSRDLFLECSYEFGFVQNHETGSEARRNKANVRLSMKHALFE